MGAPPIYLDHHATTPVDPRVLEAMLPVLREDFYNPASTIYPGGRRVAAQVEQAREAVAALVGVSAAELVFTSGATESDNLAIRGALMARAAEGRDGVVTLATEHHAVLDVAQALADNGQARLTVIPVGRDGLIALADLEAALDARTALVSVMLANNEIGAVQNLAAIAAATHAVGAWLHVDAAQGLGYLPFDARALGVDLVSVASHKIYGPKGVGALAVRNHIRVEPTLYGGGQEKKLRPGTLNVPGIVGLGAAARIQAQEGPAEATRIAELRGRLAGQLLGDTTELGEERGLEAVHLNGPVLTGRWSDGRAQRHPGNLSLRFEYVEGAKLLLELADEIALSSGSACSTGGPGSHVLAALARARGDDPREGGATLRFGLGRGTTSDEVERVAVRVREVVQRLRSRSAGWRKRDQEIPW